MVTHLPHMMQEDSCKPLKASIKELFLKEPMQILEKHKSEAKKGMCFKNTTKEHPTLKELEEKKYLTCHYHKVSNVG